MAVNNIKALNKALKNIKEEVACNSISVIKNPSGFKSGELIELLDEEYNIRIANGLGPFADKMVRVGHMNLGASKNSLVSVINAFREILGSQ